MYKAVVSKIYVSEHPDPQVHSIAVGLACNNTVIVSKKVKTGDLGIYFECDGQLSLEFCKFNKLLREDGGYFDENRRVRAQKFRGVRSDGFWIPIDSVGYTGVSLDSLKEGDSFESLGGYSICSKYETEATKARKAKMANKQKPAKKIEFKASFPKHFDTEQFRTSVKRFQSGDLITISEKLHGTSQRFAFTKVDLFTAGWSLNRLKQMLGLMPKEKWDYLVGTRNVTLYNPEQTSYYSSEKFRFQVVEKIQPLLKKGEIIFFEVVGWTDTGKSIMPKVKTDALKNKKFRKKYGESFYYSYGCQEGQADIFVYRIANLTPDGYLIDLPWNSVKERCKQLFIKPVPEMTQFIFDGDYDKLQELVEELTEGESTIDSRHIREGVCVRAERYPTPLVVKNKSFPFKVLEGIAKDNSDYEDMEEMS